MIKIYTDLNKNNYPNNRYIKVRLMDVINIYLPPDKNKKENLTIEEANELVKKELPNYLNNNNKLRFEVVEDYE